MAIPRPLLKVGAAMCLLVDRVEAAVATTFSVNYTRCTMDDMQIEKKGVREAEPSTHSVTRGQTPTRYRHLGIGAVAFGAFALGASAIGALAIGSLAIGAFALNRGRVRALTVDSLEVRQLHVGELIIDSGAPR